MKSLLLMDWYVLWKQLKLFLVMILFYFVSSLVSGKYLMMGFSVMFLCMLPYYLMQMQMDTLFLILPCTRRQIVQERYVSALLMLVPGFLIMLVTWLVMGPESIPLTMGEMSACMVILAIEFPLVYRLGSVRARLLVILTIALFFGTNGALVGFVSEWQKNGEMQFPVILWFALPASLILLGISYLISLRIYEKREY